MRKAGFLLGQCADTKETWTFWGFAAIGKVGKKKHKARSSWSLKIVQVFSFLPFCLLAKLQAILRNEH